MTNLGLSKVNWNAPIPVGALVVMAYLLVEGLKIVAPRVLPPAPSAALVDVAPIVKAIDNLRISNETWAASQSRALWEIKELQETTNLALGSGLKKQRSHMDISERVENSLEEHRRAARAQQE